MNSQNSFPLFPREHDIRCAEDFESLVSLLFGHAGERHAIRMALHRFPAVPLRNLTPRGVHTDFQNLPWGPTLPVGDACGFLKPHPLVEGPAPLVGVAIPLDFRSVPVPLCVNVGKSSFWLLRIGRLSSH